jgi:hypothetical protein
MADWLLLTASLPASPSALRVRIWRALKATGCEPLRDGVYLLPATAPTAAALRLLEAQIRDAGAGAHLLELNARDAQQQAAFEAAFDRTSHYTEHAAALKAAQAELRRADAATCARRLRALDQQLASIREIDFFPGKAADRAGAALQALRQSVDRRFSPGEPADEHQGIEARTIASLIGKTWATRRRPWVDRLATAWLVRRHIDSQARFVWLASPSLCPKRAIGFDFDGATFTHAAGLVSFEVLARSTGLTPTDPALQRLGELVHHIDVGGLPIEESAGLETLVRGLHALHADDDALLDAALPVFDALAAAFAAAPASASTAHPRGKRRQSR